MGKNSDIIKSQVRKGDKKKVKAVKKINYTPETLAAAIAKNIRAEQASRDLVEMLWKQGTWGEMDFAKLLSDSHIEIDVPLKRYNVETDERVEVGITRKYIGVSCPTTGCIAGWAASLAGDVMVVRTNVLDDYDLDSEYTPDTITTNEVWSPSDGEIHDIANRAQALLGLDYTERCFLFSEERVLAEVLNVLDTIATGGAVQDSAAYKHHDNDDNVAHIRLIEEYDSETGCYAMSRPYIQEDCEFCQAFMLAEEGNRSEVDKKYTIKQELRTIDIG